MAGKKKNLKFIKKIFVIIACILFLVFLYINIVSSNKNKQAINSIINLEQYNDFEFYDILPKLKVLDDNKKVIENKKFNKIIVQIGIYKNYKFCIHEDGYYVARINRYKVDTLP